MTIKQITVVPGMGVEVNTKEGWEVARKCLVKADGKEGEYSLGQWTGDREKCVFLGIHQLDGVICWGVKNNFLVITLHDLRHATNVVTPEEQALIDDEFTMWDGGECPVDEGVLVDVVMRDGERIDRQQIDANFWDHKDLESDIIAYRLHQEHESQPAAELFDEMHEMPHGEECAEVPVAFAPNPDFKKIAYRLHQEADSEQPEATPDDLAWVNSSGYKLSSYEEGGVLHMTVSRPNADGRELSTLIARNADLEAQVEQLTAQLAKIKAMANV